MIPIYFATAIPADLYAPGTLQDRWFMRDEAYLLSVLAEINRILDTMPSEDQRVRLTRARDLSVIPALNTIFSRATLTWDDLFDAHWDFAEQGRMWHRSGMATLDRDFALAFDYRMIPVPLAIGYEAAATEAGRTYLDKIDNGYPMHPDVWLQSMPLGAGMRPNAVLPDVLKTLHMMYPEANYQPDIRDPLWWRWSTQNAEGKECGTLAVLVVNGGGWYGTWPRVKGYPQQNALALYGAEAHFRGKVCGVPDPFHVMFQDWPDRAWGESHEIFGHGIGNISCHSDMTGLEADSWTALRQQTGEYNSMPLAGHWLIPAQTDQLVNAATLDGSGKNDILTKIPKPAPINVNADGSFGTPLFPFPQKGGWFFNGMRIDALSKITVSGRLELRDGGGSTVAYKDVMIAATVIEPTPESRKKRGKWWRW